MSLLSANIFLCESTLTEKTDRVSALRITDTLSFAADGNRILYYDAVTTVSYYPYDGAKHILSVRMCKPSGVAIATAPDHAFAFGFKLDPLAPGGYRLITNFTIDTRLIEPLDTFYMVWAVLDGELVAKAPIMLRRTD